MNEMRKPSGRGRFRTRLFAVLLAFAVVPTILVTVFWAGAANRALSMVAARSAWERIAASGDAALGRARAAAARPLDPATEQAVRQHEVELRRSVELARRADFVASRSIRLVLLGAILVVAMVGLLALRVAGHLSRQLSRPLDELVGWTALVRQGRPLPPDDAARGAPEFALLRRSMRDMADGLEGARRQALEAERAEAFRESARRFAHELKNPLTPIRFAVARLRADAPPALRETIDVLAEESARLEALGDEGVDLGGVLRAPLLPLLPNPVVEDQHPLAVEAVDDRLEDRGARLEDGDAGGPPQDLAEGLSARLVDVAPAKLLLDGRRLRVANPPDGDLRQLVDAVREDDVANKITRETYPQQQRVATHMADDKGVGARTEAVEMIVSLLVGHRHETVLPDPDDGLVERGPLIGVRHAAGQRQPAFLRRNGWRRQPQPQQQRDDPVQ